MSVTDELDAKDIITELQDTAKGVEVDGIATCSGHRPLAKASQAQSKALVFLIRRHDFGKYDISQIGKIVGHISWPSLIGCIFYFLQRAFFTPGQ